MIIQPSFSNLPDQEIIHYFIEHSELRQSNTTSSNAMLFELHLQPGIESPYFDATYLTYPQVKEETYRSIRTLFVKMVFIDNNIPLTREVRFIEIPRPYTNPLEITCPSLYDVQQEITTHSEIYQRSIQLYQESICPAMIYHFVTQTKDQISHLFERLQSVASTTSCQLLTPIQHTVNAINNRERPYQHELNVGVMFLQYLPGMSMYSYIQRVSSLEEREQRYQQCQVVLEKLYRIGYLHGDPHLGNFFFQPDSNTIQLLDFGRAEGVLNVVRWRNPSLCLIHSNTTYTPLQKSTLLNYEYVYLSVGYHYEHYDWLRGLTPYSIE